MSNDSPGAELEFTWDPAKAAANLANHGVAFARGATVFADALALTVFDHEHSGFEERWFTLGMDSAGKLLALSHAYTAIGPTSARVRIISAREGSTRMSRGEDPRPIMQLKQAR